MHGRAAVLLHPALPRTPWHVAAAVAAGGVTKHLALTLAVVAGGAAAAVLVLLLAVIAAPLAVALLTWVLWRSSRDGTGEVKRSLSRARRRARALGLHVVRS